MKNDPSGSVWRKWDLHFHTPSSYDYKDMSVTNEEIIAGLKNAKISAVAITDHHTIDVERIRHLQELGGKNLTVFPGIELRSELGGSETVHFIGIFPEDCDAGMIWDKLKGKLDITARDVEQKGNENIYVPFEKAAEVIHGLGGLITVHAGKKTNSLENIGNTEKFKMAFKKDLAERHIDILEVKSSSDVDSYWKIVFPIIGFPLPVVIGSDNHNIKNYDFSVPCWIKADCTFAGLTHVLHEPKDRVFVGDIPPPIERVNANRTKYLRTISVRKCHGSSLSETWFDCSIPLNTGLIAVVGNKGSGKSALADIVGFLGNTKNHDAFSFLSTTKFRQPKSNKSEHFEAESVWENDLKITRKLSEPIAKEEIERVNYIPQDYLEGVCNELNGDSDRGFSRELRQVIYSHVSQADRLGFDSLDELLDYKTKETTDSIEQHKKDLTERIKRFLHLSDQSLLSHRKTLENQLASKRAELAAHDSAKPHDIIKPENDDETKHKIADIEEELRRDEVQLGEIEREISTSEILRSQLLKRVAAADKILKRIQNLEATVKKFQEESVADCNLLSVEIDDIIKLSIHSSIINSRKLECDVELNTIALSVGKTEPHGLTYRKTELQKSIKELRDGLDAPNRRFQEYLVAIGKWKDRRLEIEGDENTSGTVNFIIKQLTLLDTLPEQINEAWRECISLSETIYSEIQKLTQAHRVAFGPVQSFVENHPLAKDRFDLRFDAALVPIGFADRFLAFINQGRKGSFSGVSEGRNRIEMMQAQSEFETTQGVVVFLNSVKDSLTSDLRHQPPAPVSINDQVPKGLNVELFSYVLGLEYLKPQVTLRWAGKDIEQLSPGERGTVLLVFYLLIDKSDIPLVIDQPEENLDNQTVVDFLVPSVKEAKERRQIILVTHNPNLAVVCDADQVIYAYLDKNDNNRISYESGAIENPTINQRIVDILEGTRRAFDNRDGKYHAEKTQSRPRHKALPEKRDN